MSKHENIDKKQLLEKLKKDVSKLEREIEMEESKKHLFVSDYVLPFELESIVGHLCLMNKRDYYVALSKHIPFDTNCVYMVIRDSWRGTFTFAGEGDGCPYLVDTGILDVGDMASIVDEDILIPIIDFKTKDIPEFFLALVEYSDKGYTITNQTICRKSGIEVED